MRKIAATYIFPGNGKPLKNGILVCENDGTVVEVIDTSGVLTEQAGLEFYSGILVPGFVNTRCHLGSDSLALNHQRSIFAEMLVFQQNSPELTLEELIKRVCFNSAQALKIDDRAGSFEKGKKPGVNLISGIDFKNMKLTGNSKIKRLI